MPEPFHPELGQMRVTDVLRALGDPTRLAIVRLLADDGETLCSRLYEVVGVSKSLASHHFRVLREAGVIRRNHSGRSQSATLRSAELDERFPGLIAAVLAGDARSQDAADPETNGSGNAGGSR